MTATTATVSEIAIVVDITVPRLLDVDAAILAIGLHPGNALGSSVRRDRDPPPRPRSEQPSEPEPELQQEPLHRAVPPPPPWPETRAEFPEEQNYKVLYDACLDKPVYSDTHYFHRGVIRKLIKHAPPEVVEKRVKGKHRDPDNTRDIRLYRFEGETFECGEWQEAASRPQDPRKAAPNYRVRTEFIELKYEYDENSTGPPPPTCVLFTNLHPLTSVTALRRHVSQYGQLQNFIRRQDPVTGQALGVVLVEFTTHLEARRCVEKENGRRGGLLNTNKDEEWTVVFDADKTKADLVVNKLLEMQKREREQKQNPLPPHLPAAPVPSSSHHPQHPSLPARPADPPRTPSTPNPIAPSHHSHSNWIDRRPPLNHSKESGPHPAGSKPADYDAPMPSLLQQARRAKQALSNNHQDPANRQEGPGQGGETSGAGPSSASGGEEEKPKEPELDEETKEKMRKEREEVLRQLAENGHEYLEIYLPSEAREQAVKESAVRDIFEKKCITPQKVLIDHTGVYATFAEPEGAARAFALVEKGKNAIAIINGRGASLKRHRPPAAVEAPALEDHVLLDKAQSLIFNQLKFMLERDIMEKVLEKEVENLHTEREKKRREESGGIENVMKSLSFKKPRPKAKDKKSKKAVKAAAAEREEEEENDEGKENDEEAARPKKKQKKEAASKRRSTVIEDVESEEEDETPALPPVEDTARKRATSEIEEEEEEQVEQPVKKKLKLDAEAKRKKVSKKKGKKDDVEVEEVVPIDEGEVLPPPVAQITVDTSVTPSRTPSPSPTSKRPSRAVTPPPTPPPDLVELGICEDEEDLYFAKLVLAGIDPSELEEAGDEEAPKPSAEPAAPTSYRKHETGSARTEGFYKIDHKDKAAYVAQYQTKGKISDVNPVPVPVEESTQHVTSSRSNRANARRRAQGLEEINQVQRAVALSKGEAAANELSFKFNQLQTRKKHLRFSRSPIHDWGLYAQEKISRGEMVIEYVGEVIRAQVAEKREKAYERQGIGSSYLFRIDEELVVDATKKGNLGRLINHSCDPNCTAKIITINGEKKIVIYAKQDIEYGDEITYDYHFPFEQDKIPCLCGSAKCRGYLN
ncbi:hypothetical protein H1R20_g555, partial [Candolleomyces eurysporus]